MWLKALPSFVSQLGKKGQILCVLGLEWEGGVHFSYIWKGKYTVLLKKQRSDSFNFLVCSSGPFVNQNILSVHLLQSLQLWSVFFNSCLARWLFCGDSFIFIKRKIWKKNPKAEWWKCWKMCFMYGVHSYHGNKVSHNKVTMRWVRWVELSMQHHKWLTLVVHEVLFHCNALC